MFGEHPNTNYDFYTREIMVRPYHCPECIAYSLIKRDIVGLKKILRLSPFKKYHDIAFLPNISELNFSGLSPEEDNDDEEINEQLYRDADGLDPSEADIDSDISDNGDDEEESEDTNEYDNGAGSQLGGISNEANSQSESIAFGLISNGNSHGNGLEVNAPPMKIMRLSEPENRTYQSMLQIKQSLINATITCAHQPSLLMNPEPNENCFAGVSLRFIALWIASRFNNLEVLDLLSAAGANWSQPMRFHYSIGSSAESRGPLKMNRLAVREVHPIYWILKRQMGCIVRHMILKRILKHSPQAVLSEIFEVIRTPVINFDGLLRERLTTTTFSSAIGLFVNEFWFRNDAKDDILITLLNYGSSLTDQRRIVQTSGENKASYTIERLRVLSAINNLLVMYPLIFLFAFKKLIAAGLMDFHGTGTGEDPVRIAPRMFHRWDSPSRQYSILDEWLTFCDRAGSSNAVLRAARVLFSLGYGRPELRVTCNTDADPRLRAEQRIIIELRAEGVYIKYLY